VKAPTSTWSVGGTATFQTSSATWLEETQIRAYRDQGKWYFVPPQLAMQNKWEEIHYTEADFSRDRRDEIEVPNPPSAPVEITDVHVYMDRKYPSFRNIKFKLRNNTSKRAVALSVRIGNESGTAEMSGPFELEAKKQISIEETVAAYGDFCGGLFKDAMVVKDVSFADGSGWEFKKPVGNDRAPE
jgi:hypothetical protein